MSSKRYSTHYWEGCFHDICQQHGMSRYQLVWDGSKDLESETFILGKYYVQLDFVHNITRISSLDVIILGSTTTIPHIVKFDLHDQFAALDKLKLILTFS